MISVIFATCFFLVSFFYSPLGFALSTDQQQVATINADAATLNPKTGFCIYRGHVVLKQGTTSILADNLTIQSDGKNQLEHAIAKGNLASYSTMPDNSTLEFIAMGETIDYYPKKNLIVLRGQAKATQGKDSFAGPVINYDTKSQMVTTPFSKQNRTTIVIQPDQKLTFPKQ